MGGNLRDFGFRNGFLDVFPKARTTKERKMELRQRQKLLCFKEAAEGVQTTGYGTGAGSEHCGPRLSSRQGAGRGGCPRAGRRRAAAGLRGGAPAPRWWECQNRTQAVAAHPRNAMNATGRSP